MSFGSRLKERREAVGLTQKELGVVLGVSGNAIGNYEKGISSPNASDLYKVFDLLNCDADYLFQDEMATYQQKQMPSNRAMKVAAAFDQADENIKKGVEAILQPWMCTPASKDSGAKLA